MENSYFFILLPHISSSISNPFYLKVYQTVSPQSVKAIVASLTDTELFFDYEDYETFYDGEDLSAIIKLLDNNDDYLGLSALLLDAVKNCENWRDDVRQGDETYKYKGKAITGDTLCEMAARYNADDSSTYCILNKGEFSANADEIVVSMYDKTFRFSCLEMNVREMAEWLEINRRPKRQYHWNKKHGENGLGAQSQQKGNPVSILYCSREEASEMLHKAVGVSGDRRLFWLDNKHHRYMVFMCEIGCCYHSFHVEDSGEVPLEAREKIARLESNDIGFVSAKQI